MASEEKIKGLFAGLPEGFGPRADALAEINQLVQNKIAAELAPALNAHLEAAKPEDAAAKKQLATDVMEKLTGLGLAIRCPVTGQPSGIKVVADERNTKGRFFITPKGSSRATITRSSILDLLPLALVEAQPRREALQEWRDRVSEPSVRKTERGG